MRIGIDVSPLTLQPTGVGAYTAAVIRHLLPLAVDAEVLGLSSGLRSMDGAALAGLAAHRHLPVASRLLYQCWSWTRWPKVDRLLGGVDVFHATNYFLPPVASARRVLTVYDLAFLKMPELCSPKIVGPFSSNVRRFCRESDAILTCSAASKRDIVECCGVAPGRIEVAYGAVDEAFFAVGKDEAKARIARDYGIEGPFLLFVGTIEPRKNVAGIVRAFARIAGEIPHTLVLAGGLGWKSEPLDELIEGLGIGGRIRRTGYVRDRADLPAFYSAAEAFIFPSFYEGFGLPVLEAMACGCPVITANTSSLPEVAGEAALYVEPGDTEGLVERLLQLLGDEALRKSLAEKGRLQARKFSWEAAARVTLDTYRKLSP